jgi:hypothetical protein
MALPINVGQATVVAIQQSLNGQAHPQPEAQDEVLQGDGTAGLVFRIRHSMEQGFSLGIQFGGQLFCPLLRLVQYPLER